MGKFRIDLDAVKETAKHTIKTGERANICNVLTASLNYKEKCLDVVVLPRGQKRAQIISAVTEVADQMTSVLTDRNINKVDFTEASGRGTPDNHKIISTHYLNSDEPSNHQEYALF